MVAALSAIPSDHTVAIGLDPDRDDAGVAVVSNGAAAEVIWVEAGLLGDDSVMDAVSQLGGEHGVALHDGKSALRGWQARSGNTPEITLDTAIASYLIDPSDSTYLLSDMVLRYTEFEIPSETGVADGQLDFGGTAIDTSLIAARNALGVDRLIEPLRAALDAQGLSDLNDTIEVPLVAVLSLIHI